MTCSLRKITGFVLFAVLPAVAGADDTETLFERHVRPQLLEHCTACHGPEQQESSLRLDSREAMLKGGTRGPAVVPGNSNESLLIRAIRHVESDLQMPPEAEPLGPAAIDTLARWIDQGAPWPGAVPLAEVSPSQRIEEIRQSHWAFSLPTALAPADVTEPAVTENDRIANPIDQFIFAELEATGLAAVRTADRRTLIRRATFDLTGLPPTPEEIEAFVADDSAAAYPRLIERLLDRTAYGERWGRHWLDLARYADTAGDASDYPVPEAYLYRNYVIDAFNQDLPYNAFIREQIAGDLLSYADDDERWRQVIATGYLAIARRIGVSPHAEKHVMLEDVIDNLGKTFLGLSLGCARCHDHKFDPVSTNDYYALYGIFDSSVFPHAGAEHKQRRADFVYRLGKKQLDAVLGPYQKELDHWQEKIDAARERKKKIRDQPGTEAEQQELISQAKIYWREHNKIAKTFPKIEIAYAISEGNPHDVAVQKQGDPGLKGDVIRRGFLQLLGGGQLPEGHPQSGRRELAEWIADPENPLTARVMVNRIWHYHFGRGLVPSTSDFGLRGESPSHPPLLDYLARYFIEHGWSVKAMHRLIMLSTTYRLSSDEMAEGLAADPENRLLWRAARRRLSAEQVRDAVLAFSGQLDRSPGVQHPFPHYLTFNYRQHEPFKEEYRTQKRSVYMLQQRIQKIPFVDLFDGPDGNLPFAERKVTSTALQSLYLMNSPFIHAQSEAIAERLLAAAGADPVRVAWAYATIFGRPPAEAEVAEAEKFMEKAQQQLTAADTSEAGQSQLAWAAYLRSMLASNAFLYVD
jgi:cytochrome c553